jgi:glycerophosphoryl diester phosphodiesterase
MKRLPVLPDEPRPLLFAHRGLSVDYPENSLASFSAARDAGIPGIELDVHLTRDGKLAVIHDDFTGRTARFPGKADVAEPRMKVESCSMSELLDLDIGEWKDRRFAGQKILTLEELFEEFGSSFYFDVEIKSRTTSDNGLESLVAMTIANFGLRSRCVVSSFNPFSLRRFKAVENGVPTAVIWSHSDELYWFLKHGEGRWIGMTDFIKPEHGLIRGTHKPTILIPRARPIIPWVIDEPSEAARLLNYGCEGIISNCPDKLTRERTAPEASVFLYQKPAPTLL